MIRLVLLIWGFWMLLRRLVLAHLAVVNDGSPAADTAFSIADVTLAQAFYGRLNAGMADYYRFDADPDTHLRLSMLIPERRYAAGFRPLVTLIGPGLPAGGMVMPPVDAGMHIGTTTYRRTQQANLKLAGGTYLVEVRAESVGVYCFCVGTREPAHYADATTRARVHALLES